ncbi:MAG TPA: hypothetical protein VHX37_11355 [Acidobacteriaceae bacterium]|jgi:hypothetical protein|nr:hypothetical protein [Acidobacteriaceae bacterium]
MRSILLFICVTSMTFGIGWTQEVVQTDAKPIKVVYNSGEVEHYIVRWQGTRKIDHHEDGHPSEPLKGWLTDTRQCFWSIDTQILRRVYLLNHNGQEFAQDELTSPLVEHFANKGSDYVVTQLRPENCNDADTRYKSDVADSTKHMAQVFSSVAGPDYQAVLAKMRAWPGVKSVEP